MNVSMTATHNQWFGINTNLTLRLLYDCESVDDYFKNEDSHLYLKLYPALELLAHLTAVNR